MTTDYSYTVGDTCAENSGKISKGIKKIFIITAVILACQLIWLFAVTPFIPFTVIDVHGFSEVDRNVILHIAGINDASSFLSTNVNEIKDRLLQNVLIESAHVYKRFPDRLSIMLTPRLPAAVSLTIVNGKQSYIYIDRQGVFYKAEDSMPQEINIPVISGLDNPKVNMRLPDSLSPLTKSLSEISQSSPELLSFISEIRIEHKAWEGYELVLYPVHSSIKVRVENNINEDMLRYILLMLSVFNDSDSKPAEIDFRSGMGSYKIKEQSL